MLLEIIQLPLSPVPLGNIFCSLWYKVGNGSFVFISSAIEVMPNGDVVNPFAVNIPANPGDAVTIRAKSNCGATQFDKVFTIPQTTTTTTTAATTTTTTTAGTTTTTTAATSTTTTTAGTTTTTTAGTSTTTTTAGTTTTTTAGTTTTTTTACTRPAGLTRRKLVAEWDSTSPGWPHSHPYDFFFNVGMACSAFAEFLTYSGATGVNTLAYYYAEAIDFNIGSTVYNVFNAPDCSTIPNGSYWLGPDVSDLNAYFWGQTSITIVTISGGVITALDTCDSSTTTTSTTTTTTTTTAGTTTTTTAGTTTTTTTAGCPSVVSIDATLDGPAP